MNKDTIMSDNETKTTATQSGVGDPRTIVNLTQHKATPEQVKAGVVDVGADQRKALQQYLTFDQLPDSLALTCTANAIAAFVKKVAPNADAAMIGGAPYLMPPLEKALRKRGVTPLYAFFVRESEEKRMEDGSIVKTAVFKHLGFVEGVGRDTSGQWFIVKKGTNWRLMCGVNQPPQVYDSQERAQYEVDRINAPKDTEYAPIHVEEYARRYGRFETSHPSMKFRGQFISSKEGRKS